MSASDQNEIFKEIESAVHSEIQNEVNSREKTLADMKSKMRSLLKEVEVLSSQIQITQEQQKVENERSPEKVHQSQVLPKFHLRKEQSGDGERTSKGNSTNFAKNLPRVAKINAKQEEARHLRAQQDQKLFDEIHVKYPECRTTVFEPTSWTKISKSMAKHDRTHSLRPSSHLKLEFVHGYHNCWQNESVNSSMAAPHGNDDSQSCSTNNAFSLISGEMIYYTSGVVVMYDEPSHSQRYFFGDSNPEEAAEVSSLAVHPDGITVASGYAGKSALIMVWNSFADKDKSSDNRSSVTPEICSTLNGHSISVRCLNFSADGKLLVSLGGDVFNTIVVWDWKSSMMLAHVRGHSSPVYSVEFNPYQYIGLPDSDKPKPGQALVEDEACYTLVSCGTRHIRFWTLRKIDYVANPNSEQEESAFTGSTFGSPSRVKMKKRQGKVWRLEGNAPKMLSKGQMQDFTCFTFVDDSLPLCAYSEATKNLQRLEQRDHTLGRIVAGTAHGDLYVFWQPRKAYPKESDKQLKRRVKWWETPYENIETEQFVWEPNGHFLYMVPHDVSTGNRFKISKEELAEIEDIESRLKTKPHSKTLRLRRKELGYKGILGHNGAVLRLVYDEASDMILSSGIDGKIMAWQLIMDIPPGVPGVMILGKYTPAHSESLILGTHELRQIGNKEGQPVEYQFGFAQHKDVRIQVRSLSWSRDRIILGTNVNSIFTMDSSSYRSEEVCLQPLLVLTSHQSAVSAIEVHPTRCAFASVSDKCFTMWNMQSRQVISSLELPVSGSVIAFNPDGNSVLVGTLSGEIILIDITNEAEMRIRLRKIVRVTSESNEKPGKGSSVAFSKNRSKASQPTSAAASVNRALTDLKYSPNGMFLAIGSRDNSLHLIDVEKGYRKHAVCFGHSSYITHLDWSVDSKNVQSNSADGEILYWDILKARKITDTINTRDIQWNSWTSTLGWPVQGIWKRRQSTGSSNILDIAAVCKTRGSTATGQEYECVATADLKLVRLHRWPCLRSSKCRSYKGHSSFVQSLRFSRDDSKLITAGGQDCSIFQWSHIGPTHDVVQLSHEDLKEIGAFGDGHSVTKNIDDDVTLSHGPVSKKRRGTGKASLQVHATINPTPPKTQHLHSASPSSARSIKKPQPQPIEQDNHIKTDAGNEFTNILPDEAPVQAEDISGVDKGIADYADNEITETPAEISTQLESEIFNIQDHSMNADNELETGIVESYDMENTSNLPQQEAGNSVYRFQAIYDFQGENDDELSFRKGDLISVTMASKDDDWWYGAMEDGSQGSFPGSYIEQPLTVDFRAKACFVVSPNHTMGETNVKDSPISMNIPNDIIKIKISEASGRTAVSNTALSAGDTVLTSCPIAAVSLNACGWCFENDFPLRSCSHCRLLNYCSIKCQKLDWKSHHREECKGIIGVQPHRPTQTLLLALRILLSKTKEHPLMKDLVHFYPDFFQGERGEIYREMGMLVLHMASFTSLRHEVTLDCATEVLAKIRFNGFTISTEDLIPIGIGLYPTAAIFNHSCEPNCIAVFDGRRLVVRYVANSRSTAGCQLSLTYIDNAMPMEQRRRELSETYAFYCNCARCASEEKDAPSYSLGVVKPKTLDLCLEAKKMKGYDPAIALKKFRQLWETQIKEFSPPNFNLVQTANEIACLLIELERYDEAYEFAEIVLNGYRKLLPPSASFPSLYLSEYRMGLLENYRGSPVAAKKHLKVAFTGLLKSHGPTSKLVYQIAEYLKN